MTKTVEVAAGDGSASGVVVGIGVGVLSGVGVAGVNIAVWVWKNCADNVPTLCVRIALISGVGDSGGCPAQEPRRTATNNIGNSVFRTWVIFTSKKASFEFYTVPHDLLYLEFGFRTTSTCKK